jgi:uncharacterized iron-regulated protein
MSVVTSSKAHRLAAERRAFHDARARIAEWEGPQHAIARYRSVASSPSRFRALSSFETLVRRAAEARVTYVGDFHTNPESQRTLLRLVRSLGARSESVALGTEFVAAGYQDVLDRYLAGKMGDRTFLDRIRYRDLWPYDVWEGMRPVLHHCREAGIPVLALDALQENVEDPLDLDARDAFAASRIAAYLVARPDARLVVHFGELHVADDRLPRAVDLEMERLGQSCRRLLVSQNAERIYWRLVAQGRDRVRVVEVGRRHFCVINTRPHLQQEDYLDWLERDR